MFKSMGVEIIISFPPGSKALTCNTLAGVCFYDLSPEAVVDNSSQRGLLLLESRHHRWLLD
jgi:hypothetical protein